MNLASYCMTKILISGLSESRLDESIRDHEVLIQGYKIFRNCRNANGGGVAIYVKDTLPVPKIKQKAIS